MQRIHDLETTTAVVPSLYVPWERPGRIGRIKPNTGAFTKIKLDPGTVALPSLYWDVDTTTGAYRIGSNNVGFAVGGIKRIDISGSGLGVVGNITVNGVFVQTGQAGTGTGGQIRHVDDGGTLRWVAGILGSAGATNYTIYDTVGGVPGLVVKPGGQVEAANTFIAGGTIHASSGLTSNGGFGCNTALAQASYPLTTTPVDLATSIAAIIEIQTALRNNGICS